MLSIYRVSGFTQRDDGVLIERCCKSNNAWKDCYAKIENNPLVRIWDSVSQINLLCHWNDKWATERLYGYGRENEWDDQEHVALKSLGLSNNAIAHHFRQLHFKYTKEIKK